MSNYYYEKINLLEKHGMCITCTCFLRLMYRYGIRINDMRAIKRSDIVNGSYICVQQSKHSEVLICQIVEDMQFWREYASDLHSPIDLFSYSFFYKALKRYGFEILSENGGNSSVTHSARKNVAREIYSATNDIKNVKSALGHKSVNSSLYYLTNNQKKCVINQGILQNASGEIGNLTIKKRFGYSYIYLKK